MKIGIIGAGNIGSTLAGLLTKAGHEVAIANSRGPDTLTDLVRELGTNAHAATVQDAATFGDLVIEAIPFGRYADLPAAQLAGKILVTAANYYPNRDGQIDLDGRAQSRFLADHLQGVRVVKAFNTIWAGHLKVQGDTSKPTDARRAIFIAGDDPEAKQIVADLIDELGFGVVDIGSLADSTKQEPDSAIYNVQLTVAEAQSMLNR